MPGKSKSKSPKKRKKKFLIRNPYVRVFGGAVVVMAALLLLFVFFVYMGIFGPIPSKQAISKVRNHSASLVFSYDGRLIGKYFLQNRMTIDQEFISPHVKNALIATEDSRFFKHKGLDFISLGRVFVKSLVLGNRSQGGGSTISQQLARNLYPRLDFGKFTLPVNKVREIFIASRIEKVFSKDEVLALYLNTVPFGENIFGIEVAARQFFGQPSSTLDISEAAVLVGMLAANTAYNPRIHPERSAERRNIVLDRMAVQGFLSRTEADSIKAVPIQLNYGKLDYNNGPAPYFVEYIRPKVLQILTEQVPDEYNLFTDGLRIYTTLDSTLQEYANQAVKLQLSQLQREFENHWSNSEPWSANPDLLWNEIRKSERFRALTATGLSSGEAVEEMRQPDSIIVYDWKVDEGVMKTISPLDSLKQSLKTLQSGFMAMHAESGHILAWVGGRNFEYFKYDHVTANRQAGSAFKPVLYTAALKSGMDPCEYISNELRVYEDFQNWSPQNSDGNHEGWYSLKGALVNSVNTVSAELIHQTGIEAVINQARQMGIESDIPEVPSIALGVAELNLLELVKAYSSFPSSGFPADPLTILRIEDWQGNLIWEAESQNSRPMAAMDPETARVMVEIMRGVVERGTGRSLRTVFGLRSDLAGKTGTTQDNADGWFIGYNPVIVAGAWVGADQPSIHFRSLSLGQGAHTSLPIFAKFFQKIEKDPQYRDWLLSSFPSPDPELLARLDCIDYSLEDPNMTLLQRIFESIIRSDTLKSRELSDPSKQKEQKDKKEGIFNRLKKFFKKN